MMWHRLAWLLPLAAWMFIGCLNADGVPAEDGVPADEAVDEPWQEPAAEIAAAGSVEPEPVDQAVCQSLAQLERRCFADEPATIDVDECALRYACSRRLWRMDAEAVYACVRERPCDDHDPVMTCLEQVGSRLEPSEAEQRFDQVFAREAQDCEDVVEVAPGLSDVVYEMLGACLVDNETCEAKAACSEAMLGELLDEICGPAEPPEPPADEGILL